MLVQVLTPAVIVLSLTPTGLLAGKFAKTGDHQICARRFQGLVIAVSRDADHHAELTIATSRYPRERVLDDDGLLTGDAETFSGVKERVRCRLATETLPRGDTAVYNRLEAIRNAGGRENPWRVLA
jgi:hypothetical protein